MRTPSVHTRAGTLSGGNIQKVLLARELSFDPKVVVFHKPTYGLDVKTTGTVRDTIRELAQRRRHRARDLDRPRRAARDLRPRSPCSPAGGSSASSTTDPGPPSAIGALMVGDASFGGGGVTTVAGSPADPPVEPGRWQVARARFPPA